MSPKSATRDAPPWTSWTAEQWLAYRDQQLAFRERGGEEWWRLTGRACVAMAESHIARLRQET